MYVYDDTWDEKKILIKPYIDFYPSTSADAEDWTNKIDRAKPLSIKPMSELNARYYHYKFKEDNDFYNENYKKNIMRAMVIGYTILLMILVKIQKVLK